ncbi:MAG TPA: hypothetical protein VL381_06870 [Rhodocyclaceae bacterium]|nr:hypothetical protein [Rhodocyclaceae bacterium]
MLPRIFLLSFCIACASAFAAEPETAAPEAKAATSATSSSEIAPIQTAEARSQYAERVTALNTEVAQRRATAERIYSDAKIECWKKFLVSSCLEDARQVNRREIIEIQKLERESRGLEREVKRYDAAQHAAQLAAENARKDAENEAKAAEYRAKQEAAEAKRASKKK